MKFFTVRHLFYFLLSTVLMVVFSCQNDPRGDKHAKEAITTHLKFDEVLFSADSISPLHVVQWEQHYPYFFNLFVNRIIHLPPTDSAALALNLQKFVSDKDVKDIHARVEKVFSSADKDKLFSEIEIPLVKVLAAMETEGINLDVDFLKKMSIYVKLNMLCFLIKDNYESDLSL